MGLLSGIGAKVRGLLGDDAFLDHLAQAQAFANGDPMSAARIGQDIREWREKHPKQGHAVDVDAASAPSPQFRPLGGGILPQDQRIDPSWIDVGMSRFGRHRSPANRLSPWPRFAGFQGPVEP